MYCVCTQSHFVTQFCYMNAEALDNMTRFTQQSTQVVSTRLVPNRMLLPSLSSTNKLAIRIPYNMDTNVILTVTGSTYQLRGSINFQHSQLFLGYRPMSLSRKSTSYKLLMGRNRIKLSKSSMGSSENGCIIKRVCLILASQWAWKETENLRRNQHGHISGHWRINVKI